MLTTGQKIGIGVALAAFISGEAVLICNLVRERKLRKQTDEALNEFENAKAQFKQEVERIRTEISQGMIERVEKEIIDPLRKKLEDQE